jgi:hypothetical protein
VIVALQVSFVQPPEEEVRKDLLAVSCSTVAAKKGKRGDEEASDKTFTEPKGRLETLKREWMHICGHLQVEKEIGH